MTARKSNVSAIRKVEKAAESGSRRDFLVALRDRLWEALHDERTQPRDLSPLALRLKELQAEIAAIDAGEEYASAVTAGSLRNLTFDAESI